MTRLQLLFDAAGINGLLQKKVGHKAAASLLVCLEVDIDTQPTLFPYRITTLQIEIKIGKEHI